ncbi:hypothetical protein [Glaciihabitans sp. UYNi722]|uniref:hypothetical protein n=1 Tax=Glaciihabitans sp. UYNi722 TaxID=3156344 RepID=UPI003396F3D3
MRPFRVLLRPVIAWNYSSGVPTRLSAGTPSDAPHGAIEGRDPLSLLVVGGIAGAGIGVQTFEQALACQFAMALAQTTGRGVDWESLPTPNLKLAGVAACLRELNSLPSFDIVLVLPGVADALALASHSRWRAELQRLLAYLTTTSARTAKILVGEVQDVARHVQVRPIVRGVLEDHVQTLNADARSVCAEEKGVHLVRLPEAEASDYVGEVFSYSSLYRRWGRHLAEIVPQL